MNTAPHPFPTLFDALGALEPSGITDFGSLAYLRLPERGDQSAALATVYQVATMTLAMIAQAKGSLEKTYARALDTDIPTIDHVDTYHALVVAEEAVGLLRTLAREGYWNPDDDDANAGAATCTSSKPAVA